MLPARGGRGQLSLVESVHRIRLRQLEAVLGVPDPDDAVNRLELLVTGGAALGAAETTWKMWKARHSPLWRWGKAAKRVAACDRAFHKMLQKAAAAVKAEGDDVNSLAALADGLPLDLENTSTGRSAPFTVVAGDEETHQAAVNLVDFRWDGAAALLSWLNREGERIVAPRCSDHASNEPPRLLDFGVSVRGSGTKTKALLAMSGTSPVPFLEAYIREAPHLLEPHRQKIEKEFAKRFQHMERRWRTQERTNAPLLLCQWTLTLTRKRSGRFPGPADMAKVWSYAYYEASGASDEVIEKAGDDLYVILTAAYAAAFPAWLERIDAASDAILKRGKPGSIGITPSQAWRRIREWATAFAPRFGRGMPGKFRTDATTVRTDNGC